MNREIFLANDSAGTDNLTRTTKTQNIQMQTNVTQKLAPINSRKHTKTYAKREYRQILV